MGPGNNNGESFVVEEPEPDVYNPTGLDPPVWQPAPQDILLMFQQLEKNPVLPLKWVCPGRVPPEKDVPEQLASSMSAGEEDEEDKEEEKRAPEPSAFDFDDTASEASMKVKMTPRTPAQAKRPEKKVACMDNIISSLKRQQKAEREARKSQARSLGMTPFRGVAGGSSTGGGTGTPSRMAAFSPATSPRVSSAVTASSPGVSSPRGGSPRVPSAAASPSSRSAQEGGEGAEKKSAQPESPTLAGGGSGSGTPQPVAGEGVGVASASPKGPEISEVASAAGNAGSAPSGSAAGGEMVSVKQECEEVGGPGPDPTPMETDADPSDSSAMKQEG